MACCFYQEFFELDDIRCVIDSIIIHQNTEVPRDTEDGIPIRKVYVSNLPYHATRQELLEFFAQFGKIKNCWVKSQTQNNRAYAFITFIEPTDAHKALTASKNDRFLRGKILRVLPADSWHQPMSDSSGNVIWEHKKPAAFADESQDLDANDTDEASTSKSGEDSMDSDQQMNILDILNHDCITHIMSYVPLHDLVRSEAVSKRWRATIEDYFMSFLSYDTSRWKQNNLTTNKLRQLLKRMSNLRRLHIDGCSSVLNDRTALVIAKFAVHLEQLTVEYTRIKFWTPVVNRCKNLQSITFSACDVLNDESLISLLKSESSLDSLHLNRMYLVKGTFLMNMVPKLQKLTLNDCPEIEPKTIIRAIDKLKDLKYLCVDLHSGPNGLIEHLSKLNKLEELHLSYVYSNPAYTFRPDGNETDDGCKCADLCETLKCLKELRHFSFVRSRCLHNKVFEQIGETCTKLTTLNITASRKFKNQLESMAGMGAIVEKCQELQHVNISNNEKIPDLVKVLSNCKTLRTLIAKGHSRLQDDTLNLCIANCHQLEVLDVRFCPSLTDCTVTNCSRELVMKPRKMTLYIVNVECENQSSVNPLLTVECHSNIRHIFEPLSDEEDDDTENDLNQYDDMFSGDDIDSDVSIQSEDEFDFCEIDDDWNFD